MTGRQLKIGIYQNNSLLKSLRVSACPASTHELLLVSEMGKDVLKMEKASKLMANAPL